jgi:hypothetical protein
MRDALSPGALSSGQTNSLVAHLAQADNRQSFADSLSAESIMGLAEFERMRGGASAEGLSWTPPFDTSGPGQSMFLRVYASPIARPWFNNDEATYAEVMGEMADMAALPYYEAAPSLAQLDDDIDSLPFTRVLSRVLLPALTRADQAQARHETQVDLMQMGLLLEQYYVEHGTYPDSLDPVASQLGGALPVDPFTGDPYVYQPSTGTFLLYGLGYNQTDDGGVHDPREGDIVWRGQESPK